MIGKLTGLVDEVGEDFALIDVGGVGYVVFASRRSLDRLPARGEAARLWIETHVREDHIHLFGFIDQGERDSFRMLCTVQGVGARMALAILSVLPPEDLSQAIAAADKASLTRASGVGPKLAARMISELKDRVAALPTVSMAVIEGGRSAAGPASISEDAVSALVNLGYRRAEAFGAVARVAGQLGEAASVESLVKAGLQELAS